MRLVFWGLIAFLVAVAVRRLAGGGQALPPRRDAPAEDMVRCCVCGLNLPKSEALPLDGHWACCPEHARQQQPAARP